MKSISTIEIYQYSGAQVISLPANSKIVDLVNRDVDGYQSLSLVYEYDASSYNNVEHTYEIYSNMFGYDFMIEKSYKYLKTIKDQQNDYCYLIFYYRRLFSEEEKES